MKMITKRAYESPQVEVFEVRLESKVLSASVNGKVASPVSDAEEGSTDEWGWGN